MSIESGGSFVVLDAGLPPRGTTYTLGITAGASGSSPATGKTSDTGDKTAAGSIVFGADTPVTNGTSIETGAEITEKIPLDLGFGAGKASGREAAATDTDASSVHRGPSLPAFAIDDKSGPGTSSLSDRNESPQDVGGDADGRGATPGMDGSSLSLGVSVMDDIPPHDYDSKIQEKARASLRRLFRLMHGPTRSGWWEIPGGGPVNARSLPDDMTRGDGGTDGPNTSPASADTVTKHSLDDNEGRGGALETSVNGSRPTGTPSRSGQAALRAPMDHSRGDIETMRREAEEAAKEGEKALKEANARFEDNLKRWNEQQESERVRKLEEFVQRELGKRSNALQAPVDDTIAPIDPAEPTKKETISTSGQGPSADSMDEKLETIEGEVSLDATDKTLADPRTSLGASVPIDPTPPVAIMAPRTVVVDGARIYLGIEPGEIAGSGHRARTDGAPSNVSDNSIGHDDFFANGETRANMPGDRNMEAVDNSLAESTIELFNASDAVVNTTSGSEQAALQAPVDDTIAPIDPVDAPTEPTKKETISTSGQGPFFSPSADSMDEKLETIEGDATDKTLADSRTSLGASVPIGSTPPVAIMAPRTPVVVDGARISLGIKPGKIAGSGHRVRTDRAPSNVSDISMGHEDSFANGATLPLSHSTPSTPWMSLALPGHTSHSDATGTSTASGMSISQFPSLGGQVPLALTILHALRNRRGAIDEAGSERGDRQENSPEVVIGQADTEDTTRWFRQMSPDEFDNVSKKIMGEFEEKAPNRVLVQGDATIPLYRQLASTIIDSIETEYHGLIADPGAQKDLLNKSLPTFNAIATSPLLTPTMYDKIRAMYFRHLKEDPNYPFSYPDSIWDAAANTFSRPDTIIDASNRLKKVLPDRQGYLRLLPWSEYELSTSRGKDIAPKMDVDELLSIRHTKPLLEYQIKYKEIADRIRGDPEAREKFEQRLNQDGDLIKRIEEVNSKIPDLVYAKAIPEELRTDELNTRLKDLSANDGVLDDISRLTTHLKNVTEGWNQEYEELIRRREIAKNIGESVMEGYSSFRDSAGKNAQKASTDASKRVTGPEHEPEIDDVASRLSKRSVEHVWKNAFDAHKRLRTTGGHNFTRRWNSPQPSFPGRLFVDDVLDLDPEAFTRKYDAQGLTPLLNQWKDTIQKMHDNLGVPREYINQFGQLYATPASVYEAADDVSRNAAAMAIAKRLSEDAQEKPGDIFPQLRRGINERWEIKLNKAIDDGNLKTNDVFKKLETELQTKWKSVLADAQKVGISTKDVLATDARDKWFTIPQLQNEITLIKRANLARASVPIPDPAAAAAKLAERDAERVRARAWGASLNRDRTSFQKAQVDERVISLVDSALDPDAIRITKSDEDALRPYRDYRSLPDPSFDAPLLHRGDEHARLMREMSSTPWYRNGLGLAARHPDFKGYNIRELRRLVVDEKKPLVEAMKYFDDNWKQAEGQSRFVSDVDRIRFREVFDDPKTLVDYNRAIERANEEANSRASLAKLSDDIIQKHKQNPLQLAKIADTRLNQWSDVIKRMRDDLGAPRESILRIVNAYGTPEEAYKAADRVSKEAVKFQSRESKVLRGRLQTVGNIKPSDIFQQLKRESQDEWRPVLDDARKAGISMDYVLSVVDARGDGMTIPRLEEDITRKWEEARDRASADAKMSTREIDHFQRPGQNIVALENATSERKSDWERARIQSHKLGWSSDQFEQAANAEGATPGGVLKSAREWSRMAWQEATKRAEEVGVDGSDVERFKREDVTPARLQRMVESRSRLVAEESSDTDQDDADVIAESPKPEAISLFDTEPLTLTAERLVTPPLVKIPKRQIVHRMPVPNDAQR
eukprot:jgi/Mesvir1/14430/Mv05160-RA.1